MPHIIGDERTRGSSGRDNRMFVEGVLWIVRTGSPWRDLPEVFGCWNSAFRRFSRWSAKPEQDRGLDLGFVARRREALRQIDVVL